MSRLSISLLGQFQAELDGEPVLGFRGDTARALLAYLAMDPGRAFERLQLAALLWPDHPESVALQNLRQALRRLRTAIGDKEADPPFLLATRTTIALNPEADHYLDVTEFTEAVAASKAHRHRRLEECPACVERLEGAAALYRGEFLAGFSLGSALFEEWMVVEREHLHGQALDVLEKLAACHEGREEYEQALRYARRQVEMEPWREHAHRQAMRALALGGDRAGALAQYEVCCRTLAEELGIEPDAETRALHERIRDGAALRPLAATPAHNLPAELPPFVGRKALLGEIVAHLQDPGCRLLTLVGPGGSGKTRLALEAAKAFLTQGAGISFDDGVFLVSLAPLRSSEGIVPAMGSAMGLSFYNIIEDGEGGMPKQQLLDHLRGKQVLLILDGFEHLLASLQGENTLPPSTSGAVSLVLDILHAASGVKIVATSRARLNVRGEHLVLVGGMRYPERLPETVSELDQCSAVQLFLASAQQVQPDFQPTTEDLAHVVRICLLVEGMPLALLLAAAWMALLTPAEIARELESRAAQAIDFLATDWPDVPERQRSMRAVFDHSWDLLSEREQVVFRSLSVFRGGFTREAAEQAAGASLRELMSLVNKSLLHRTSAPPTAGPAGGRYEMHELLRQYAAEHLDRSQDVGNAVRDQHSAYYSAALEAWAARHKRSERQAVTAEMDAEIENVRAAWGWAAQRGHVEQLDRGIEGLRRFYYGWRYQEGESAFREAAEALTAIRERSLAAGELPASSLAARVLIRTLGWQSVHHRELMHWELADQCLGRGQALLEAPDLAGQDVRRERALILWEMGWHGRRYGLDRAIRLQEQSLTLYREIEDQWWVGTCLRALGDHYSLVGRYDEGRQAIEESRAIYQALGEPHPGARGAWFLAFSYLLQGQIEQAERWAREGLSAYRELGRRPDSWETQVLGSILLYAGAYLEAQSWMEECLAICNDLGIPGAGIFAILGATSLHLGHYGQARALAEQALAPAQK